VKERYWTRIPLRRFNAALERIAPSMMLA